jgi:Protein of unknown function (DUF4241)
MSQWPNNPSWSALREGFTFEGKDFKGKTTAIVQAGTLQLPSGRLVIYDPSSLDNRYSYKIYPYGKNDERYFLLPSGQYQIKITQANITLSGGRTFLRNAYVSILLKKNRREVLRKILTPIIDGKAPLKQLLPGEFYGVDVDAGMICLIDESMLLRGMPEDLTKWFEVYIEDWVNRVNENKTEFVAVSLPRLTKKEKMLIVQSGWGDGSYPVIGGFDQNGQMIAIHVDFFVCPTDK